MSKVHRFTAAALGIFVIIMLFILVIGIDFQDITSFNDIFKKNPGMFWGATSITLVGVFILKYAEVTYASEVEKFIRKMGKQDTRIISQNEVISSQNKTIIVNQQKDIDIKKKHVDEIVNLNNVIIEQSKKDLKRASAINQIHGKINKLTKARDVQIQNIKDEIGKIKTQTNKNGRLIEKIVKDKKQK